MIHLVLFDIDGTLIRTGGAGVKAFERVFHLVFGVPNATRQMQFAGRTDRSLVREFLNTRQMETCESKFEQFFAHYVFLLDQMLHQNKGEVCPGVSDFIQALIQLPQPPVLGLLTGNIRLGAEIKLRHHNLWDFFVTGAFGDDHENRNQLASIASQRGAELVGRNLKGSEILVIGDTPLDVECGKSIQARTVAVATGGSRLEELASHKPDLAVKTLHELDLKSVLS